VRRKNVLAHIDGVPAQIERLLEHSDVLIARVKELAVNGELKRASRFAV
jgi:hypothetical protein